MSNESYTGAPVVGSIKSLRPLYPSKDFSVAYWYGTRCAYACPYCVSGNPPSTDAIPTESIDWRFLLYTVLKTRPVKRMHVYVTGKEPTERTSFICDMMYLASQIGPNYSEDARIIVQTNLQASLEEVIEWSLLLRDAVTFSCTFHGKTGVHGQHEPDIVDFVKKARVLQAVNALDSIKIMEDVSPEEVQHSVDYASRYIDSHRIEVSWVYSTNKVYVNSKLPYDGGLTKKWLSIVDEEGTKQVSVADLVAQGKNNFKGLRCAANRYGLCIDTQGRLWTSCGHSLQHPVGIGHILTADNRHDISTYFNDIDWVVCPNTLCCFDSILTPKETID